MPRRALALLLVAVLAAGCTADTPGAADVAVGDDAALPVDPPVDEAPDAPAEEPPAEGEAPDEGASNQTEPQASGASLRAEPAAFRAGENTTLTYRHGSHEARDSCWFEIHVATPEGHAPVHKYGGCLMALWNVGAGEVEVAWNGTVARCADCAPEALPPGEYELIAHVNSTSGRADVATAKVTILPPAEEEGGA